MEIGIKRLNENAVIPNIASTEAAGWDLTATTIDKTPMYVQYGTGLAIELPPGTVGLLYPRSSVSKKGLRLANSVGVVDSDYRGEIKLRFYYDHRSELYQVGERVAQLVIMQLPSVNLVEVNKLTNTTRAHGGFGSTGK